jgi:hypothetical protein
LRADSQRNLVTHPCGVRVYLAGFLASGLTVWAAIS